jgi:NPCBM-associated, NEW3 domain of alpha-galactosidase
VTSSAHRFVRCVGTYASVAAALAAQPFMGRAAAQTLPLAVEYRTPAASIDTSAAEADATPGRALTLIFRVVNSTDVPQSAATHVDVPADWQVVFGGDPLALAPHGSVVDTVTVVAPRNARAGDYVVRYAATTAASELPATASAVVHIRERRALAVRWLTNPTYVAAGVPATLELVVANEGNLAERVTLDVRSVLGSVIRPTWTNGTLGAGEQQHVRIEIRPRSRGENTVRETLTAKAAATSLSETFEAGLQFDVVAAGRAPEPRRKELPTSLAVRVGTGQQPTFGSFIGSGALDQQGKSTVDFGVVSREESHPLMLERDRYYANVTTPSSQIALGDQTWSTSFLTESGRYGFGAGGRLERGRWFGGGFIDTGRRDIRESRQAAGFVGARMGPARLSVQYLKRLDDAGPDRMAEIGSVRLDLRARGGVSGEFEVGTGRSAVGSGNAVLGQLEHTSRPLTVYARRVRADATYPIRDRTALIDGFGASLRPLGQLQLEGTYDGTEQLSNETLPLEAPTRQRVSRAGIAWGALANVQVGRRQWTSPGANWVGGWLREYVSAQLAIPVGPVRVTPGAERGYEASPSSPETPFSRDSLRVSVRLSRRNSIYARGEYGHGIAGDAARTVRRVSFGGSLQPTAGTKISFQLHDSATDAPWLEGTQWANAVVDQRLPWGHHAVATYRRRTSGSVFLPSSEAYRVDYVIPVGIPLHNKADMGRVTLQIRDGDTGEPRRSFLVQLAGASLLTDANGVVDFQALTPGDYFVTVAPGSLGSGRALVPAMPLKVSVTSGRRTSIDAVVVRTATIAGVLQQFNASLGRPTSDGDRTPLVGGPALARAVIELIGAGTRRTAITDERGRFEFLSVPPGDWRLVVAQAALPPFYQLEQREIRINVAAGRDVDVVLRAVPKSQALGDIDSSGAP